ATGRGTRRGRRCVARGGGRGRGRGLGRIGLAPRGASGGCCQPACGTVCAAAFHSPRGTSRACVCRTLLPLRAARPCPPAAGGGRVCPDVAACLGGSGPVT